MRARFKHRRQEQHMITQCQILGMDEVDSIHMKTLEGPQDSIRTKVGAWEMGSILMRIRVPEVAEMPMLRQRMRSMGRAEEVEVADRSHILPLLRRGSLVMMGVSVMVEIWVLVQAGEVQGYQVIQGRQDNEE